MRWPSRECGSTCGAMLMLSWPPAMMISESPSRIAWAASITAFRPEPQTLLIVIAGTLLRQPGLDHRLARRVLAGAGLQHLAEDHLADLLARQLRALQQFGDHGGAEFGRRNLGERAAELADGGAGGGDDDDVGHGVLLRGVDWNAMRVAAHNAAPPALLRSGLLLDVAARRRLDRLVAAVAGRLRRGDLLAGMALQPAGPVGPPAARVLGGAVEPGLGRLGGTRRRRRSSGCACAWPAG